MSNRTVQKIIAVAAGCWLAVGHLSWAWADSLQGSLGDSVHVVDRYRIECSSLGNEASARLATQVKNDSASSPLLSVQAYKGSVATNSTDPVAGDSAFGPLVYANGGNGIYFVAVDKTGAGAVDYTLSVQCETAGGGAAGTGIESTQDQ